MAQHHLNDKAWGAGGRYSATDKRMVGRSEASSVHIHNKVAKTVPPSADGQGGQGQGRWGGAGFSVTTDHPQYPLQPPLMG